MEEDTNLEETTGHILTPDTDSSLKGTEGRDSVLPSPSRRAFLGRVTTATIAAGVVASTSGLPGQATAEAQTVATCSISPIYCNDRGCDIGPLAPPDRAQAAFKVRVDAATFEGNKTIPLHPCNGDEQNIPNFAAVYSKGLPHDATTGIVDPTAYNLLLTALKSGLPSDFNNIPLGCTNGVCQASEAISRFSADNGADAAQPIQRRLVNPQSALAFDLEGVDSHQAAAGPPSATLCPVALPPAPSYSSAEEIGEMAELYWMALARDVPFSKYASTQLTIDAANDLSRFSDFRGPKELGPDLLACRVTPHTLFRGITRSRPLNPNNTCNDSAGIDDLKGPYVSQFLLRSAPYGRQCIGAKIKTLLPVSQGGKDYLTTFAEWLNIQNGCKPTASDRLDPTLRYIRSGRDLTSYVQVDLVFQAFFNACLILLTKPSPVTSSADDCSGGGIGAPFDAGNPYTCAHSKTQEGFDTFGGQHLKALLVETHNRALKAAWYQKWSVHRRLRPEEFGGRLQVCLTSPVGYPWCQFSSDLSLLQNGVLPKINSTYGSYLLPQAYPEGSPLHPSYPQGHATVAGACATILKAWFIEETPFPNPVEATDDGTGTVAYTGSDAGQLTVGSELNKLASNIGLARDFAGVHWRSDYAQGILLGEAVAISVLQDYGFTYNENKENFFQGFSLTKFDGTKITVGQKPA